MPPNGQASNKLSFLVQYSPASRDDIDRLFDFWLEHDDAAAERMIAAIEQAVTLLQTFPFSCRKASDETPFLRELLIPFGAAGYVALFEIEDGETVTILAVRHQREEDFH